MAVEKIERVAYAKVNLGLDVKRRRPDGYHEVSMIMQSIGLCDKVIISKNGGDSINFATDSDILNGEASDSNLCVRAARLMQESFGAGGVDIFLEKHIPIAAGLAGGSTDAAAVLQGMNELFEIGASEEQLRELGVTLGADIPYCIMGGTALSEGIGEKLMQIPSKVKFNLVLVKPDFPVPTGAVYKGLKLDDTAVHPNITWLLASLVCGDVQNAIGSMSNLLETVTSSLHPQIGELETILEENGAIKALMSGSGPTVFGLFEDEEIAAKACDKIKGLYPQYETFLTRFN